MIKTAVWKLHSSVLISFYSYFTFLMNAKDRITH